MDKSKGDYLHGKGKYQAKFTQYEEFEINTTNKNLIEALQFFDTVLNIYKSHFKKNKHDNVKIDKDNPYFYLLKDYPQTDKEYENLIDKAIEIVDSVENDIKDEKRKKREQNQLNLLWQQPSHKYYEIWLPDNDFDNYQFFLIKDKFNLALTKLNQILTSNIQPGDIIGILLENQDNGEFPDMINYFYLREGELYFDDRFYGNRSKVNFKKTGKYNLPLVLNDIDKGEIESIYHFPFVHKNIKL